MFRYEKDMLPVIENSFSQLYTNIQLAREFNSGNGISDLTCAIFNDDLPEINIDNYGEMYYLLNFINDKGKRIYPERLIEKNNLNDKVLFNLLHKLLKGGYISQKEGFFYLEKKYRPAVKKMMSIEAKLKKWKEGYYQALRYKCFSHNSYLAISNEYIKNVDFDLLSKNNIGLIAVFDNSIKFLIKPKNESPTDITAFHHLSENISKSYFQGR